MNEKLVRDFLHLYRVALEQKWLNSKIYDWYSEDGTLMSHPKAELLARCLEEVFPTYIECNNLIKEKNVLDRAHTTAGQ